jgi:hypothetical protein
LWLQYTSIERAERNDAPNALAITRETLALLDAKERQVLMGVLGKLR